MNIYLASGFQNKTMMKLVEMFLEKEISDIKIVSEWIHQRCYVDLKEKVQADYIRGINRCDLLLAIYPGGVGTSSEIGYAIGQKKPVIFFVDDLFTDLLLPVGLLDRYKSDMKFLTEIKFSEYGYIVSDPSDLIDCINLYKNKFKK